MRRTLSRFRARWLLAALLTVLALAQLVYLPPSTLLQRFDVLLYDLRMRSQHAPMDERIVIVDIDEASLDQVGRWPWSRDVVAKLVDQLTQNYFARAVGMDVIFSEPDTSSGYATLTQLAEQDFADLPQLRERLAAVRERFDYDARLAMALHDQPVALGYFLSNDANALSKGRLPAPAFTQAELEQRQVSSPVYRAYVGNLPTLQQAARTGGFINPVLDEDGTIRRIALLARVGDAYYESLALATARAGLGASTVKPVFFSRDQMRMSEPDYLDYGAIKGVLLNSKPAATLVPVERGLTALINYRGPGGPAGGQFRYIPAVDVLNGTAPMEQIADQIVLVGTTAAGLRDLRAAPVNPNFPGVEMHANVIASILDGDFKQEPDFSLGLQVMQLCLVGVVLGLLLPVLNPLPSVLLAMGAAFALLGINTAMYAYAHWVVPVALPLLLVAMLFLVNIVWGYVFEFRRGRAMVNLFGEYVAPELVAEMAADPQRYNMEGESRELTVLFADVRGFTTISEGLDPNALREYINLYLTAMSEAIRGNKGTLDKYIGDAVMAFWGAPVHLPDHASRAVETALEMQAIARRLNADFVARNWPPLAIGIGLNTGEMRVGDMGSKVRRAYTVMGDAVNLSSRLEGITKEYGVGITVGPATRDAAMQFAYRELDRVRVKGKNEPVAIFEPLGLASELDAVRRLRLQRWEQALTAFRSQRWGEAKALLYALYGEEPETRLYPLYLERIAHFESHPPGADWDGVTQFQTK